ncbi:hypothetical protein GCM10022225_40910 [Plantactinospora mayteni]|uniref:Uncharacterized protein n=1 Tax=Plantactinospora mayteni TaxID=566021 RepID=A0ABQ4EU32_9ACTN|nr:hypothetical protein Pma05_46880 [Plantactinospora mayteni]
MPIGGTKASSTRAGSSSRGRLTGGSSDSDSDSDSGCSARPERSAGSGGSGGSGCSAGDGGLDSSLREGAEVTTANYYTYITMSSVILVK